MPDIKKTPATVEENAAVGVKKKEQFIGMNSKRPTARRGGPRPRRNGRRKAEEL